MILSILIPTIPSRKKQFLRIYTEIFTQATTFKEANDADEIEVIFNNTTSYLEGGPSIGQKRQYLLNEATGDYVCFLDDDDNVAPNYLETLVAACQMNFDVVTFKAIVKNDYYWALIDMSLQNKENEEVGPIGTIKRTPWHICPIKREIAQRHSFEDLNHNEDWTWLSKVIPELKTEIHLDTILTQYNHSEKGSEADKIIKTQNSNFENKEEVYY